MCKDAMTIVKKELKELLHNKEFLFYYAILIVVTGIVIPISSHDADLNNWLATGFVFQVIAAIVPSNLTADSFAGEKERKTLETLLSLPISTTSIYLGKVFFVQLISLCIIGICFATNIITVNLANFFETGRNTVMMYPGLALYTIFINGIAISSFVAFLGVLISLLMKSVRGANLLTFFIGMPIIIPVLIKLMSDNLTWGFILIFSLAIFIIDTVIALVVRYLFTVPVIMKRI